ncbi:hypothetical protein [Microbacterium sp. HJ5]
MSAYDLFALHLSERETAHVDLERRRVILEHLAREKAATTDASPATAPRTRVGLIRLLPRRA